MRDEYGRLVPGEYNAATGQPLDGRTPDHDWSEFDQAFGPKPNQAAQGAKPSLLPATPQYAPGQRVPTPATPARPEPLMTGAPLTDEQKQRLGVVPNRFEPSASMTSAPPPAAPTAAPITFTRDPNDPFRGASAANAAPGGYGGNVFVPNAEGGVSRVQYNDVPDSMEALHPGFSQMTPEQRGNLLRRGAGLPEQHSAAPATTPGGAGLAVANPYGTAYSTFGPQTAPKPQLLSPHDVAGFSPVEATQPPVASGTVTPPTNPAFTGAADAATAAASAYARNRPQASTAQPPAAGIAPIATQGFSPQPAGVIPPQTKGQQFVSNIGSIAGDVASQVPPGAKPIGEFVGAVGNAVSNATRFQAQGALEGARKIRNWWNSPVEPDATAPTAPTAPSMSMFGGMRNAGTPDIGSVQPKSGFGLQPSISPPPAPKPNQAATPIPQEEES